MGATTSDKSLWNPPTMRANMLILAAAVLMVVAIAAPMPAEFLDDVVGTIAKIERRSVEPEGAYQPEEVSAEAMDSGFEEADPIDSMTGMMLLQIPETPEASFVQETRHHHRHKSRHHHRHKSRRHHRHKSRKSRKSRRKRRLDEKAKEKLAASDDQAWRDMSDHSHYGMKPAKQGPKKRKNFPWTSCVMHCMAGEGGGAAYTKSPERVEHPNADHCLRACESGTERVHGDGKGKPKPPAKRRL